MGGDGRMAVLAPLLEGALASGDDGPLRAELVGNSGRPGARLNLGLVSLFARAVGDVVTGPAPPVAALERLLDGWAGLSPSAAPGDGPAVILPCAAVASYGEVGAVRTEWWDDEIGKLRRAARDGRSGSR